MSGQIDIKEVHWLLDIVQCIDVGVIVLDRHYSIEVWNSFMESHSSRLGHEVKGKSLFDLYPEIDKAWLCRKLDMVKQLNSKAFISWEQRPYLFRFSNYRPITGSAEFMYQNITIMPLPDFTGQIDHVAILIYDVTDQATNTLANKA